MSDEGINGIRITPLNWRGIFLKPGHDKLIGMYVAKDCAEKRAAFLAQILLEEDALFWITALFFDCQLQYEHVYAREILLLAREKWPSIKWDYILNKSFRMLADRQLKTPNWESNAKLDLRSWVKAKNRALAQE